MDNPLLNATVAGRSDAPLRADMRLFHGRYLLRRLLGAGGMGVVWLAEDLNLKGKTYALKFLPGVLAWSEAELDRLKREVMIAQELRHEHVVATYGFEYAPPYAAMVMEHLEGRTLKQVLEASHTKFLTVAETRPWAMALISALRYLHHTKKHVHRDLKPANVMLTQDGMVKLMDFGISDQARHTLSQHVTIDNGGSHTLSCASPQQLGERPAETDDIYSLGALLYELLSGRPPFFRGNSDVVGYQIRHAQAPSIAQRREELKLDREAGKPQDEVPSTWEDAVAACLEKEPAARPTLDDLTRAFSAPAKARPVKREEPLPPAALAAPPATPPKERTEEPPAPVPAKKPPQMVPAHVYQDAEAETETETETAAGQQRRPAWLWKAAACVVLAGAAVYALSSAGQKKPGDTVAVMEPSPSNTRPVVLKPTPPPAPPRPFPSEQEALRVARSYYEAASKQNWQEQRRKLWAPEVNYFNEELTLAEIERKERQHRALWDQEGYTVKEAHPVGQLESTRSYVVKLTVALDFSSPAQTRRGTRNATLILGLYEGRTLIESIITERVGNDAIHIDPETQRQEIEAFLTELIALGNKTEGTAKAPANFDNFYDERIDRFFDDESEPKKEKLTSDLIAAKEKYTDERSRVRSYWWAYPTRQITEGQFGNELLTMRGEISWEVTYNDGIVRTGGKMQNVRIIFNGRPRVRAIWLDK